MKIDVSTNEYKDLLDMLHIADVVMSGHRRDEDPRTERHRALIQKLYALAHKEALDRLISYNESSQTYSPTADFEQSTVAHVMIHEFEDHVFWDELIARLSMRDAAQIAGGIDRLKAMSDHDRQHVEGPIRQHYISEFAANGVANLALIDRFDIGGGSPVKTSD